MRTWPYPRVVAHRGGGKLAPENTLEAIDTGARLGLKMIEFDAKLSADNVVFLLHDDDVDRTSNGHGAAKAMSYAQLAALDAGSWFDVKFAGARMPTLEQVAARCKEHGLAANVEIKPCEGRDVETGRIVAHEAARLWADAEPAPLLSSFSYAALAAAREAAPDLPRGMLYGEIPDDWRAQTAALACVSLHADHRKLNEAPRRARSRIRGCAFSPIPSTIPSARGCLRDGASMRSARIASTSSALDFDRA